jgi:hypothetical protein
MGWLDQAAGNAHQAPARVSAVGDPVDQAWGAVTCASTASRLNEAGF